MKLFFIHLTQLFKRTIEECRVTFFYYRQVKFMVADLMLKGHYLCQSPYRLSKAYLTRQGADNVYTYGETPLTTLDVIMRRCRVLSEDTVYDLGCGTGRTSFWLAHFVKCEVIGVDLLSTFIKRANRINRWFPNRQAQFVEKDMLECDYQKASVVYLYGTALEDEIIIDLAKKMHQLKAGSRVITVSYPLTDYDTQFKVVDQFEAPFEWGTTTVYLNVRLSH